MPLGKISLLTSGHHVSLPRDHRKKLKDQIHKEEVTFEYTLKKSKKHYSLFLYLKKQTNHRNQQKYNATCSPK
jgi:hypothetical protein